MGPSCEGALAVVDVFDLDRTLVADYASFARSFTQIRARDIRDQVDSIYASRRFWPEPLITINPHFEQGASVEALVRDGSLHPEVARVFRVDGNRSLFTGIRCRRSRKPRRGRASRSRPAPVRESPSASSYRSSTRRSARAPPANRTARG